MALRLQERDLDMLYSLSVGRFLTVQMLEWLHFPSWRERWQHHHASRASTYYPLPNVYIRLYGLEAGGLVCRIRRPTERARLNFTRLADVYGVTQEGVDLLLERRNLDGLDYTDSRQRSFQNLEHSVGIATFYAALRTALEYAFAPHEEKLVLADWQGDHLLGGDYDKLAIPGHFNRRAADGRWGLVPDATFVLELGERRRRYFLEVDRGRRGVDTWLDKARTYERYRGSGELEARYGVKDFVLLVVAPTARRLERIAETIAKVQPQLGPGYLFIPTPEVHPLTIRAGFRRVVDVQIARPVVAGRLAVVPTVRLADQPLWKLADTAKVVNEVR